MIKKATVLCMVTMVLELGAISGCKKEDSSQSDKAPRVGAKASSQKDSVRTFIDAIKAYNLQDFAALSALMDPDVEWTHRTASRKPIEGRSSLIKTFVHERATLPDCNIGMNRILAHGRELVVQGVFRATHLDVAHGIEPTGKKVSYEFAYFVSVKSGRIKRNTVYFNMVAPFKHIGAIPTQKVPLPKWPEKIEVVHKKSDLMNKEQVKQFYAIWETGNFERLDEFVSPNFILNNRATVESYTDSIKAKNYLTKVRTDYKDLKFEVEEIISAGPYVAVRLILKGKHRMKPERLDVEFEKDVELDEAHVFKLAEGKIVEIDIYLNEFQRYRQFGYSTTGALARMNEESKAAANPKSGVKTQTKEPNDKDKAEKPPAKSD
ncbi:MAG: ester cyclase [Proteobacteria bacterium]|nr:ester cyclase [Pseudomonadota bacterium]